MTKKVVVLYSNESLSESQVSKKSTDNVVDALKKLGYLVDIVELNSMFVKI